MQITTAAAYTKSQLKSQSKLSLSASQSIFTSQLKPSIHQASQSKEGTLSKGSNPKMKSSTQLKALTHSKMSFQSKTLMQQVRPQSQITLSPQSRPSNHQQKFFTQNSTTTSIAQLKSTLQTKSIQISNTVNGKNTSQIFKYANNYPNSKIVNDWSIEDVIEFLNLRLYEFSKYENEFRSNVCFFYLIFLINI